MFCSRRLARWILLFSCFALPAHSTTALWPGGDYDPAIPTVEKVLGYAPGERISWSHDVRRYFDVLAAAAPDRVAIHEYATSWEGRRLFYAVISSPENLERAEAVQDAMAGLAELENSAEAKALIETLPAVTWLAYGVHGNEISSTDAAMYTAYHLLASRDDARAQKVLADTIVVINPMQNPDGRDRFIHRFETALGLEASPDRRSAEHNEPWPSGRTNHYLFDMNRDWFIRTQPETRGHADAILEWRPVAFVDLHEMGSDSTYYFAPEAVPFNPHLTADQRSSLDWFGRTNARWFDRFGIDYFTREVYDAFYPGYGASWPAYAGSIAMTYEQSSARGLKVRKYDGTVMPYAETVRNHFLTSMGTVETVAEQRVALLKNYYDYQRSAIEEGRSESVRAFVLSTDRDRDGLERLGALLAAQGARLERATDDFSACGESFPAGSLVANLDQPAKRLLRTLLDRHVAMEEGFVDEQVRRRQKNLPDEIYDITAWSLPLLFNVESTTCAEPVATASEPVSAELPVRAAPAAATVAYLVPWGERSAVQLLSRALRSGVAIKTSDRGFVNGERSYPAGTLIIDVADNGEDLHALIESWVAETRAEVVAVDDSWVTEGPNFGSGKVQRMRAPRVALAWDEPTSQYSAGNFRFVVERQFDYPVTPIRVMQLATNDLDGFDVLVLPDLGASEFEAALGEEGIEELRAWVKRGGVLVGLADATVFLADPDAELLPTEREYALENTPALDEEDEEGEAGRIEALELTQESYAASIEARDSEPASVGGVFLAADVDPDHWLGAGVAPRLHVLSREADSYRPLRLNEGTNVVRFAPAEELVASGQLWDTHRRRLALKPFVMASELGRGHVIAFTQDPTVRAYQDGLNVLVANAIFRAAAHARPRATTH